MDANQLELCECRGGNTPCRCGMCDMRAGCCIEDAKRNKEKCEKTEVESK